MTHHTCTKVNSVVDDYPACAEFTKGERCLANKLTSWVPKMFSLFYFCVTGNTVMSSFCSFQLKARVFYELKTFPGVLRQSVILTALFLIY